MFFNLSTLIQKTPISWVLSHGERGSDRGASVLLVERSIGCVEQMFSIVSSFF